MKTAPVIGDFAFAMRGLWLIVLGIAGFFVLWVVLHGIWLRKHEKLAHMLCDSIPVGMPAAVAKERASELSKSIPEVNVKNLSIELVFLSPYSPGTKIVCQANIFDDKIFNNEVWAVD